MTANELRQKYLDFFKSKGHAIVPSASLIPENDPTTLFTSSGMQPIVSYFLGEKHPMGTRITDSQKCFRSPDIEDVGDNRHTTFFEMLGNWSFGDYFKKEQVEWMFEFLTEGLKLDPNRIYISVYRGNDKLNVPRDNEAVELWQEQFKKAGIQAKAVDFAEKKGIQNGKIFYYDEKENWWSRSGAPSDMPAGEPGGPDSEMFWDFGAGLKIHENSKWKDQPCHPACDCGRFVEIGNNVFMQYKKVAKGFEELENKNIDFGGGLERLAMAVADVPDVFLIDLFKLSREKIEELSHKKYSFTKGDLGYDEMPECWADDMRSMRVILDHLRAATFLINDGANPSNKDQGYFTRRLIRRAVRFGHQLGIEKNFTKEVAKTFIETYGDYYTDLRENEKKIYQVMEEEEKKFRKTLMRGLKQIEKAVQKLCVSRAFKSSPTDKVSPTDKIPYCRIANEKDKFSGRVAFNLYQTYGFPIEMTVEELKKYHPKIEVDIKKFEEKLQKHKDLSRTASAGKFKGGLAGDDKITTQLHTVTHLMLAGLRKVLGGNVSQKGANITPERIRFDFSFDRATTDEEKQAVEKFVNDALQSGAKVELKEMPKQQAIEEGVTGSFWEKYPEIVKVYTIIDKDGTIYSRELCGGPHVENLSEIKGTFKIQKEKSSGAGVRRVKATVE